MILFPVKKWYTFTGIGGTLSPKWVVHFTPEWVVHYDRNHQFVVLNQSPVSDAIFFRIILILRCNLFLCLPQMSRFRCNISIVVPN
jgi:hypothetical protein